MMPSFSHFHFQEPVWFLALILLAVVLWLANRNRPNMSSWSKVIDKNLLPFLLQGKESKVSKLPKWLLAIGGLLAITALADPVWEKIPRPIFQTNSARVIVLDLSNSMLINDLKPSRLARARFKIEDMLSNEEEGQIGLVVFAGDAFTASPLTRDVDTIRNLLKVFTPSLMPSQGSRVDYGLIKAHELLKQANVHSGQVLLIADGVSNPSAAYKAAKGLKDDGFSVSVLGVGTEEGGFLRLRTKKVNIKLDADILKKIAKNGGGGYHKITSNSTDLTSVLKSTVSGQTDVNGNAKNKKKQSETDDYKREDWKSTGPYLLLLLLPLAAFAFRKGWLLTVFIAIGLSGILLQPQAVYAEETSSSANSFTTTIKSNWQKLWLNSEQRADRAFKQKQFEEAEKLSQAPLRKGSSAYKGGDYKSALNAFKKAKGADARYNEGNTLLKLKKYKEAINAYDEALKLDPEMADARENKQWVEVYLKEKKKQKKRNKDKNKKNSKDKNKDKNKDKYKQDDKGKKLLRKDKKGKEISEENKKNGKKENQFADANKNLDKKKNADKQDEKDQQDQQKKTDGKEKGQGQVEKDKQKKAKVEERKKGEQSKESKEKQKALNTVKAEAEKLTKEEKMAADQWLRRIPDDPGGLLRRKFRRQYQRSNRRPNDDEQPW